MLLSRRRIDGFAGQHLVVVVPKPVKDAATKHPLRFRRALRGLVVTDAAYFPKATPDNRPVCRARPVGSRKADPAGFVF